MGSYLDGKIGLSHRDHRVEHLAEFIEKIRETALPWFAATREPARLADIPDQTIDFYAVELAELLVSRGQHEQATELILRWRALGPRHRAAFAAGRELTRQGEIPDREHTFGWSSVILALI